MDGVGILLIVALLFTATIAQWIAFEETAPFFRAFDTHTKHEWVGRINSSIAQIGLVALVSWSRASTVWGFYLLAGYLLYDTAHMLIYERDFTHYIHHIATTALAVLEKNVMTPEQANVSVDAMLLHEATSPVLHASWLMNKAGYGDHPAFKYLAGFAATFFGLLRVVLFPWLMYTKMDKVTTSVFLPLLGLNVFWFSKIIGMARKIMSKKTE